LGTRTGAALLALLTVLAVAAPAAAGHDNENESAGGALGAIYPGLEVEGWVTPTGALTRDADATFTSGPVEDVLALLGGGGFTWADRPYAMDEGRSAAVVGADSWHRSGRIGEGITIAVVDLGFAGYRSLLGSDLPQAVEAVSFRRDGTISGGTSHGTAAAEIVHDVAPGADLHLVAFDGDLFRVVQYLIDEDVDIVSFSVGYLSGPFDGTSPASRAAAWAIDSGIVWVTAAGNFAESHWGGVPSDRDGDRWLEFAGTDEINEIVVAPDAEFHLYLSWVGGGDLDLCIYELPASVGDPIACAAGMQDDDDRGLEVARWKNDSSRTARFGFSIREQSGAPTGIDVMGWNIETIEHGTASGSVIAPGDVGAAVTVGAVWWSDPGRVMAYSGRGPTAAGIGKPDLVAPTGLSTTSWGSFGGTSGATPHVAGVAALLLESYPATPAREMGGLLAARAVPEATGVGAGAGVAAAGSRAPNLVGTGGDDRIVGTAANDVIHGRGGADTILGGGGVDVICGGTGNDVIYGQDGGDRLFGNHGDDRLFGGAGRDQVLAGAGNDRASGGDNNDLIKGGPGDDRIWGGSGRDRCTAGTASGCE